MPFPTFCSCIRFPSGGMAVAYRGSASGRTYFLEKKLAKARESLYIRRTSLQVGRFPSGQRGQTVNLLAFAFEGSNPSLPTTFHFMARSFRERVFYCFIIPMIPGKERGSGVLRAGCTKCFFLPDAGGETVL